MIGLVTSILFRTSNLGLRKTEKNEEVQVYVNSWLVLSPKMKRF